MIYYIWDKYISNVRNFLMLKDFKYEKDNACCKLIFILNLDYK